MLERFESRSELRVSGRTLTGYAIQWGDVSPSHRERFAPGAISIDGRTRWLNLVHRPLEVLAWTGGGGLDLSADDQGVALRAELPAIPAADLALDKLKSGELRGLSVEFRALQESRAGGIRIVERADLEGVGLVRSPSYQQSTVEVRARSGQTLRARIPANEELACQCSGIACMWAEFAGNAMREMLETAFEQATREVVAGFGSYTTMPLASRSRGTLRGRLLPNGDGEVDIDLPDGAAGQATRAAFENAGVIVRPHLDVDASEYTERPYRGSNVRSYTRAVARAFVVSATDQRDGWPDPELIATPDFDAVAESRNVDTRPRAATLWL